MEDRHISDNITISEEELGSANLSTANRKLATMLLHTRGYVVLRNAVPKDLVQKIRTEFADIYQDCEESRDTKSTAAQTSRRKKATFWEKKARMRICPRLEAPLNDSSILANPFVTPILGELLGQRFYCKYVSSDTCKNGSILQSPHRDIEFYKTRKSYGYIVNVAIMDCGLDNGPIEVWPGGSHLWKGDLFKKYRIEPNVQDGENPLIENFSKNFVSTKVALTAGDILIRDPGMWHRGTPNPCDEPRTMLTIGYYRRGYFYPYNDPYCNVDKALFENLDPRGQKVFDYCFRPTSLLYWRLQTQLAFTALEQRPTLGAPLRWCVRMIWRIRLSRLFAPSHV